MILPSSNEPFKTLPAATSYMTRKKLSTIDYKVEQYKDGFAIVDKSGIVETPQTQLMPPDVSQNVSRETSLSQPETKNETKLDNVENKVDNSVNKEIKKTTRPWSGNDNRWKPDMTKTPGKHVGFRLHFSNEENVQVRLDEGYQVAKAIDYGCSSNNSSVDGVLRRKGMIGMEIPEEDALSRDEYLRNEVIRRTKGNASEIKGKAKQISNEAGEENLVTFGSTHNV